MNDVTMNEQTTEVFDQDELMARCLGKIDLVERLLKTYHTSLDEELDRLEEALVSGDAEEVARVAHRLKGSSSNVAARSLQSKAAAVEVLARQGNLENANPLMHDLRRERARFVDVLTDLASFE